METQSQQQQPQDTPAVEASGPQTAVETVPLAEVQKWLEEQIKPYLQRIEKLEEITSKKDSQIHCLELALQRFQQLVTEAKLAGPANNNHIKTHPTAVNGNKRPSTAVPVETKEDKKPITKPTPVVKPAFAVVRSQTATNATTTEKKEEDDKKHPVIPHKTTKTSVKKDESKADEEKKTEEIKKIEKKPAAVVAAVVKKDADKEDKKPARGSVTSSVPSTTEKKPTGTPKPAVKKEDPKAKKDAAKETVTAAKDEKKHVGAATGTAASKNTVKKQEPIKTKEENKNAEKTEGSAATAATTKSDEKPAETGVEAVAPVALPAVEKQVNQDEQVLDSAKPKEEDATAKPEQPVEEEEESI